MRRAVVVAMTVAALVGTAAACGDDDGGDASPPDTAPQATTDDATSDPDPGTDDGGTDAGSADGGGDTGSDDSTDTGGSGAGGTLVLDGEEVALDGFCGYLAAGGSVPDVAAAQLDGQTAAGENVSVVFAVSGAPERNTQVTVAGPTALITVRWERDGSLAQSSDEGSYELAGGTLTLAVDQDGSTASLEAPCDER